MKALIFICLFASVIFFGCMTARYIAPDTTVNPLDSYSKIINKPFDRTWSALIQYAGSAFFGIDNFEKESGLLTLSFGASNPSDFITGGRWKTSGIVRFDGDYVDYCVQYLNGRLEGKMNVIVVSLDSNRTRVIIKARYVFTAGTVDSGIETWSFESGTYDTHAVRVATRGTQNIRTLMPTYYVEKMILDAIEEIQ